MANRTKNASTEDDNDNTGPLVQWAVKLTADLKEDEKTALKNIKKQGTPEFQAAALVLQNIVKRAADHVQKPTKSRPGPKKSVNPTDDDIATLWSCIRMILKLPATTTQPCVSERLIRVLKETEIFLGQHLLLNAQEAQLVRMHLRPVAEASAVAKMNRHFKGEFVDESTQFKLVDLELNNLLGNMRHLEDECDIGTWGKSCTETSKVVKVTAGGLKERGKSVSHLQKSYVKIARLLELHKAPMVRSRKAIIEQHPFDDEHISIEFPDFCSIKDLKLGRKSLLWAVIDKLFHLHEVFHTAQFGWKPLDAADLIHEIEEFMWPFNQAKAERREHPFITGLGFVKKSIISATVRQRISPFSECLIEVNRGFPSPTGPGQAATNVEDAFEPDLDHGQANSRNYFAKRAKRRRPRGEQASAIPSSSAL